MASADRLIEVFTEAKARPVGAERDHFLSEACHGDPDLKQQVLALLKAHESAGDFLENKVIPPIMVLTERPGDKIGRYKLLQQIGEGGCGVVYMAEQEEPVRRRVAIKVIKLGMDTKSVIARFEAERQALALMDHANIAKVLDAGATETGRPYFVMELVRGIKITDYCDQNNISTEGRLKLFMQVCQAIQHAHQKGIIHRDIKPSNILVTVTEPGSPGCPRIIDFGIAKATAGERLTDKTVFTAFEQFIGTPAYMSPEQAMMTSLDIDTRTDIYALGVLLYELLTGTTPFDAKDLMVAGLDAMRRTILEQEPARPSTRLSTMLEADLTTVAKHRQSEPAKLGGLLRGDLDWIVMKALEKDRARRYDTSNGLAADIRRHLDNEPVTARPPSSLYRFQKLVRRNKLAVAAVSAVTAALIFGLGVSTWMFFKEKAALQRAVAAEQAQSRLREEADVEKNKSQTQAVKSQQVATFLQTMLKGVGPTVALGRDTTLLREILDKTAARIGRDLTNQPEVELELRTTLFNAYVAIGEADKSEEMARSILRLTQSFAVAENIRAEAWQRLGYILRSHGKLDEAEQCARQALGAYRKIGGKRSGLTDALMMLSGILNKQGRLTESEPLCREAVATTREMFGNDNVNTATMLTALAYQLRDQRKLVEAESAARESLAILRKLLSRGNVKAFEALCALTGILGDQGKWAEAEKLLRDEMSTRHQREHPDTIRLSNQLGHALQNLGRLQESETMLRDAVASARKTWANNTSYHYYRESFEFLLEVLTAEGKLAEVETIRRELMVTWAKKPEYQRQNLERLSAILTSQEKLAEVETLFRELLVTERKQFGDVHREVQMTLSSMGQLLQNQRKWKEAEAVWREALAIEKKLSGDDHINNAWTLGCLAGTLQQQGKLLEAETLTREQLAIKKKALGGEHPQVSDTLLALSKLLREQGKLPEAETTAREAAQKCHTELVQYEKLASDRNRHQECWSFAISYETLGQLFKELGQFQEAEKVYRDTQVVWRKLVADFNIEDDRWHLAINCDARSQLLKEAGRFDEATEAYRQALAVWKELVAEFNKDDHRNHLSWTLASIAGTLQTAGKRTEAEQLFREAESALREDLALRKQRFGNVHREVDLALAGLAKMLRAGGKLAEAEAVLREELALEKKLSGDEHPYVANSLDHLAGLLFDLGKLSDAETVFHEGLVMRKKVLGAEHTSVATSLAGLTKTLLAEKKFTEAETIARECLEIREKKLPNDWLTFNSRSMLGGSLLGQKKYADAEPLLISAYEGMKQPEAGIPDSRRPRMKENLERLVQLYEATGQSEKAVEWNKKLAEFDKENAGMKAAASKP